MTYKKEYHRCSCGDAHTAYSETKCDSCNTILSPVFPPDVNPFEDEPVKHPYLQLHDTLHIELTGGYGEYIDNGVAYELEHEGEIHILLCHDCARAFFEANPWMVKHLPAYNQDKLQNSGRLVTTIIADPPEEKAWDGIIGPSELQALGYLHDGPPEDVCDDCGRSDGSHNLEVEH